MERRATLDRPRPRSATHPWLGQAGRRAARNRVPGFALALFAVLALATATGGQAADAQAEGPQQVVERINEALLDAMRNAATLGFEGRYERLEPVLRESFNLPLMARGTAGRYWRELTPAQRDALIERFTRLSIASFAARFDGYSGESFRILGQQPGVRDTVLVQNQLLRPGDEPPVGLNYLLKAFDGRWQVIDIFLDAKFSEIAVKRSEYTSVIKNEGFDSLLASLDEKIAELAAEG